MKQFIQIIIGLIIATTTLGQSLSPTVIPSSGGVYGAGGVSLSYTVGQTANVTFVAGGVILTQGFQQPTDKLYPLPVIRYFTPTYGANGKTIIIRGNNFSVGTPVSVSFGGVAATSFTVVNDTSITAVLGTGASGNVSVTTPGGTATKAGFSFCTQAVTKTATYRGCNSVVYKGKTYTSNTTVKDTVRTVAGCDSIYNVASIVVTKITATTVTKTFGGCNGVFYNGITYYSSTTVSDTVRSVQGCDSIYNVVTITIYPKPNLGNDIVYKICPGKTGNLTNLYNTSGYTSVVWSTANPSSITAAGTYMLNVTNSEGCKDTAVVTVSFNVKPNLGADKSYQICPGGSGNIKALYTTTSYSSVVWSTARPDIITATGNYTLIVTNSSGCMDTAVVIVTNYTKPNLGKDTSIITCTGSVTSIRGLYDISGYTSSVYSTSTPDAVGKGNYKLIVTNSTGCRDTAIIGVIELPMGTKPVLARTGNTTFCINDSMVLTTTTSGYYQWFRNNTAIKKEMTNRYAARLSGSYKLRVNTATTCNTFSDSVMAVMIQVAKPTISLVNDTLVSSYTSGNQWYFSGSLISGATKMKLSPNFLGSYTLQVTSAIGCKSTLSDPYLYTANTFAKGRMLVKLYPNPTTGKSTLEITGNRNKTNVTITDVMGRSVRTYTNFTGLFAKQQQMIDLCGMPSGVYFVTISDGIQTKRMELVKGK